MNSVASQSSSSGCVGRAPWVPKSSVVATRPRPKYACQSWFIRTRPTSGFVGSTSQRASVSRLRGAPAGRGWSTAGTPGSTGSAGLRNSPRRWTCVVRACSGRRSCITIVVANRGIDRRKAAIGSRALASSGATVR